MAEIHIADLEAAINWWGERAPAGDGLSLAPPLQALAELYGRLVWARAITVPPEAFSAEAWDAWLAWYETTPDTPCIAICSTSQGDAVCKGCGRSFDEVQYWPALSPAQKRAVWRRISAEGSAWRFNRYAERAGPGTSVPQKQ